MRKALLNPLFITASLLFAAHQLSQKVWGLSLPWADSYLDPLLCMPLLLTVYQIEQSWLWGRKKMPLAEILIVTTVLSLVFEVIFPGLSHRFTADMLDVAAYFAGALLYFRFRP
jgi:hypothetical protein